MYERNLQIPSVECLVKVAEMGVKLEKPILLDYYIPSCNKECQIAKDGSDGDKFLYKNQEEYTSPLRGMFKVQGNGGVCDIVLETENSLYVVNSIMLA
tara:strand:- start:7912 stop:8205 length:294 start_codon:yes stop_codon:yes gene_type:complete